MRSIRNSGLLPLIVFVLCMTVMGCSGQHSPKAAAISVALSTAPPNSLQVGAQAMIAATVMNDSANKGVTWSCAPVNSCGTFMPTATASAAVTTYTAPATVPAGGVVTITATSVADNTKSSAPAMVTITPPPAIAVTFAAAPNAAPASINTSAVAMIAANVANDPANKGVTWSCVPTNACGTFVPAATASGAPTTYTAPANTNAGNLIIITATSVSDNTKNAMASVTLSMPATETIQIIQSPIPPTLLTGANAMFAATVSNDATNAGVNWTCSVASGGACPGTFVPTHTASGASTVYTAPASVPQTPQVTITATDAATGTLTSTVTITISAPGTQNGLLKGQYAFLVNGQVGSLNFPTVGSITCDGNGNITAGEFDQSALGSVITAVPVTGTYTVGPDKRGAMTLSFSLDGIPGSSQMAFNFALTSASHGVIAETDNLFSTSGSLDLQSAGPNFSAAQITGGYSFTLAGGDNSNVSNGAQAVVEGGIFTTDGAGGDVTNGTLDVNDAGALSTTAFTGTFSAPDTFGRGTIALTGGSTATFTYYIVTPKVLRIVETDTAFTAGGTAYGQGTVGTTDAAITGRFVFGLLGQSGTPSEGTAVVGQFNADGMGTFLTGTADSVSFDGANVNAVPLATSTYMIAGSPRGTASIAGGVAALKVYLTDPTVNLLDPNNASGGGGSLLIEFDAGATISGFAIPQANPATTTFSGSYAANVTGLQNQGLMVDFELDLSGQATVAAGGTYSGLADFAGTAFNNNNPVDTATDAPVVGSAIVGSVLTADVANPGRFTGTLTITQPTPPVTIPPSPPYFVGAGAGSTGTNAVLGLAYYQVSNTQFLLIQIDGGEVAIGVLEQ